MGTNICLFATQFLTDLLLETTYFSCSLYLESCLALSHFSPLVLDN